MLNQQVHRPRSIKTLIPFSKPFLHGNGRAFLPLHSSPSFQKSLKIRVGFSASNNIKAIAGATAPSVVSVKVKAVVTVKRTILGGTRSNNTEDVTYFKKPLFLGLVSAELDSSKYRIRLFCLFFPSEVSSYYSFSSMLVLAC